MAETWPDEELLNTYKVAHDESTCVKIAFGTGSKEVAFISGQGAAHKVDAFVPTDVAELCESCGPKQSSGKKLTIWVDENANRQTLLHHLLPLPGSYAQSRISIFLKNAALSPLVNIIGSPAVPFNFEIDSFASVEWKARSWGYIGRRLGTSTTM
jgi:hypothetical protein